MIAALDVFFLIAAAPFLLFPTIVPLATVVALLLLVAGWLLYWKTSSIPLPVTPFNAPLLLWAVMLAVGILVSADPDLTLPKATGLLLGLATWRTVAVHAGARRRLWLATTLFLLLGAGMLAVGLLSANWRFEVGFVERLFGLLPPQLLSLPGAGDAGIHTNQLAGTLTFYLFLAPAFLLAPRLIRRRKWFGVLLALASLLLLALLVLSQSRSAWIGAVAGLAALLALTAWFLPPASRLRRVVRLALLAFVVLGIVAAIWFWPTLAMALEEQPPTETPVGTLQTLSFRLEVWRWALAAMADFSFTGTGLGTFRRVVARLYPIVYRSDIAHAHNVFMQVALDVGFPGLVSYVGLLISAAWAGWRVASGDEQLRPLSIGLLCGLVTFHVYGLTDALAPGSKPALAFWFMLGLLTAMWTIVSADERVNRGAAG